MNEGFNIIDLFVDTAIRNSNKTAIIYKQDQISYSDLYLQIKQTAAYYEQHGIKNGDRVLVFVPMNIDLYRIVLSLFYMGATPVFLDEWVSKSRMEECCNIAECRAFIGSFKIRLLSIFSPELRKIKIRLSSKYIPCNNPIKDSFRTSQSDTALITFTTGSTGIPKAAKRSHGYLNEQFRVLNEMIKSGSDDIAMTTLPIVLLINLGIGSTTIIPDFKSSKPHLFRPEKIYLQSKKYSIDRFITSPYFVKELAKHINSNAKELTSITKIFTGGAPVFPSDAKQIEKAFPKAKIEIIYGSTEAEPISSINSNLLIESHKKNNLKGLNVGFPHHEIQIGIISISDKLIELEAGTEINQLFLPANEIGEIVVTGPHVLKEYYNNPEAIKRNKIISKNTIWHRTGDSGFLTLDGNLFLTGRCQSLIIVDNQVISPFVYENLIQGIEGVNLGTLMFYNSELYLLIELKNKTYQISVEVRINKLSIPHSKIIYLNKIPRDPRHFSKIEYPKLLSLLAKMI